LCLPFAKSPRRHNIRKEAQQQQIPRLSHFMSRQKEFPISLSGQCLWP
jgi:hypothetical protein